MDGLMDDVLCGVRLPQEFVCVSCLWAGTRMIEGGHR